MSRLLENGMQALILTAGVPIVLLANFSHTLIPLFFGDDWAPAARVLILLAPSYVVYVGFLLHTAAILTYGRPFQVAQANFVGALSVWVCLPP